MGFLNKLTNTFRHEKVQTDADHELTHHLDQRTRENIRNGMPEEQARLAAKRQVGNITRIREEAAENDMLRWLDALRRDTQLALRTIRKAPLFAAITILSLMLGIGANTMVFSVMKHVLLDSLPVPNADRLVILQSIGQQEGHTSDDGTNSSFSYPQYQNLSAATHPIFGGILARLQRSVTLESRRTAERASCEMVSGNYFSLLGVKPWRGRLLTTSDNQTQGGHPVAVLGFGSWQRMFGGDPAVLNKTIRLNSHPFVVVGIAPPDFYGIRIDSPPDIYVPLMMKAQMTPTWDGLNDRLDHWATLVGSLQPGITLSHAQAALSVIYPPIRDLDYSLIKSPSPAFRREFSKNHIQLVAGGKGYAGIRARLEKPLEFLSVMVLIVLLITVVNVANLLIARSGARERDMAVRLSIGAGKGALVRQVLVESMILALAGGLLGVILAYTATPVLLHILSASLSETSINAHPDGSILAIMACVTMLSAIAFGLLPALQSARINPSVALKSEGAQGHTTGSLWLRRTLVGCQIALSMLLLTGALLFTRSMRNVQQLNPGFRTEHIISFKVNATGAEYSQQQIKNFSEDLLRRLRELPNVDGATVAKSAILEDDNWGGDITVEGSRKLSADENHTLKNAVSPGYFETLQMRLLLGRTLREKDAQANVAVVNAAFANHFLPGDDIIGKHFSFGSGNMKLLGTIVGVVADTQHSDLRGVVKPFIWIPYLSGTTKLSELTFYLHASGNDATGLEQVRKTVHEADPALPIYELRTLRDVVNARLFVERGLAALSDVFAALAIILAAIGLYGVVSYSVTRRVREFGIRMAVGATPANVLVIVLRETALIAAISLACALPLVLAGGSVVRSALFGVEPNDPVICAISALALLAVAMLAGFFPARHASQIDPQVALRSA